MCVLAEISDKIVSPQQMWAVMGIASALLGAIAAAARTYVPLVVAVPLLALGCLLILSFLNDPFFGNAVLQENGWSWFAGNFGASMLPTVTVVAAALWRKRRARSGIGFEVAAPPAGGVSNRT